MSKSGHIPPRVALFTEEILEDYEAPNLLSYRDLAFKYGTNTQAISAVICKAGASRDHDQSRHLRREARMACGKLNPCPPAKKDGRGRILPSSRITCSERHLEKPKQCVMHEDPTACKICGRKDMTGKDIYDFIVAGKAKYTKEVGKPPTCIRMHPRTKKLLDTYLAEGKEIIRKTKSPTAFGEFIGGMEIIVDGRTQETRIEGHVD